jgi:hypothetical protein
MTEKMDQRDYELVDDYINSGDNSAGRSALNVRGVYSINWIVMIFTSCL